MHIYIVAAVKQHIPITVVAAACRYISSKAPARTHTHALRQEFLVYVKMACVHREPLPVPLNRLSVCLSVGTPLRYLFNSSVCASQCLRRTTHRERAVV